MDARENVLFREALDLQMRCSLREHAHVHFAELRKYESFNSVSESVVVIGRGRFFRRGFDVA